MLRVITWPYLHPLTSNISSPEGKSHLKPSVDQKVVLRLQIVKIIILVSKYWGLHAHLSQSDFIYWAHLCKMSIHPSVNPLISVASCSTSEQHFCAQVSYPQINLSSVWKASCWSMLTTSPLTRHHYFTQIPNHHFWSHASVHRRGSSEIFQRLLLSILQQS